MEKNNKSMLNAFNVSAFFLKAYPVIAFAILLGVYHLLFKGFFPGGNGLMGHDWNLGMLLNEAARYKVDGLTWWNILVSPNGCNESASVGPGFPVSFSGWAAYFGLSPLDAVYVDFLIYAAIGFAGLYLLLRNPFAVSPSIAALGGGVFMLNGFYSARLIIGHGFQAVMFVPLIVWLLTRNITEIKPEKRNVNKYNFLYGVVAGCVLAFAWVNGMLPIVVAVALAILSISLLAIISGSLFYSFIIRAITAVFISIGLCWWSLSQTIFSTGFATAIAQRQSYSLQGFGSLWTTIKMLFTMLFIGPADIETQYMGSIVNISIFQGQHELDYSIGWPIFLLFILAIGRAMYLWFNTQHLIDNKWWRDRYKFMLVLVLILLFPIVYTTFSPVLTSVWKSIPLINSTTSPQRVYFVYVCFFSVLIPVFVDRYFPGNTYLVVSVIGLLLTASVLSSKDRTYYNNQPYDPKPVLEAFEHIKQGGKLPVIEQIGMLADNNGRPIHNQSIESTLFLRGVQPMGCYVPGYSSIPIEKVKTLHPGSVWDISNGFFNIKNPVCNTWPIENSCAPGDHFQISQKDSVDSYIHHKPYPMVVAKRQIIADYISGGFLGFVLLYMLIMVAIYIRDMKAR